MCAHYLKTKLYFFKPFKKCETGTNYNIFQIKTNKTGLFKAFLKTHYKTKNSKCNYFKQKKKLKFYKYILK